MGRRISVVVVDDSALVRSLLSEIINRQSDMQCVGTAADPYAAREVIRSLNPDVLTLGVEMPRMDGIEFLSRLMRLRPMPVVMVSTLTERGADVTLRALELGAVDFVAKPHAGLADGLQQLSEEITEKIRTAASARLLRTWTAAPPAPMKVSAAAAVPRAVSAPTVTTAASLLDRVIFIGASTGGTEATREVLAGLPAHAPPVLITQHMPAGYTANYARRLDSQLALTVKEAEHQEPLQAGHAYVAPGGRHLAIGRRGSQFVALLSDGDPVNRHRPSVEVLFESAARVVGAKALGVMLTGMGGDGAAAMQLMREAGAYNVAQDEASCVVFGMPREAIRHGGVHRVLPLQEIAAHLCEFMQLPVAAAGTSTADPTGNPSPARWAEP